MTKKTANPFADSVQLHTRDESLIMRPPLSVERANKRMGRPTKRVPKADDVKASVMLSTEEHYRVKLWKLENKCPSLQDFLQSAVNEKLAKKGGQA